MTAHGWTRFEDQDTNFDEPAPRPIPAATDDELEICRRDCQELGYGGFTVRKGGATLRAHSRTEVLSHMTQSFWDRGAVLHVAPEPTSTPSGGVAIVYGDTCYRAQPEVLSGNSGYFASVFRHSWADGQDGHVFAEFPGGETAFLYAMTWLAADANSTVGEPWPVRDFNDACLIIEAAAYLDAPRLLQSAVRSWRLARQRSHNDVLQVAGAMMTASMQFVGDDQDRIVKELRETLLELPKHHLTLSSEFLAAPAAGLAVLEARFIARESLVGHIKNVGGWVGSVIHGSERSGPEAPDGPITSHEFASRLFDSHMHFFKGRPAALRQLLRHIDPSKAIAPPLCFKISAAALAAAAEDEEEVFAGHRIATDLFAAGFQLAPDPAEAAACEACVVSLFGAGTGGDAAMGLTALLVPGVPPTAAAVILSRVLSSWAAGGNVAGASADAAGVVFAGAATNRQELRTFLQEVLPLIMVEGSNQRMGSDWGSSFDYAVPELLAAFVYGIATSSAAPEVASRNGVSKDAHNDTLKLLFRVIFEPSGGLPGVDFPHSLLGELHGHNALCSSMVLQRVILELQKSAMQQPGAVWTLAESLWCYISWDAADEALLEHLVKLMRGWLLEAKALSGSDARTTRAEGKTAVVRLMSRMPLHRLDDAEALLGPPIPAHVLASLSHRSYDGLASRVSALEAQNAALQSEVARLSAERHRSN